jgi:hypothetical protein
VQDYLRSNASGSLRPTLSIFGESGRLAIYAWIAPFALTRGPDKSVASTWAQNDSTPPSRRWSTVCRIRSSRAQTVSLSSMINTPERRLPASVIKLSAEAENPIPANASVQRRRAASGAGSASATRPMCRTLILNRPSSAIVATYLAYPVRFPLMSMTSTSWGSP